jgi:hypothetical protein
VGSAVCVKVTPCREVGPAGDAAVKLTTINTTNDAATNLDLYIVT